MIEVKAPRDYGAYRGKPSVFLAGSIEMGKAEDWYGVRQVDTPDALIAAVS